MKGYSVHIDKVHRPQARKTSASDAARLERLNAQYDEMLKQLCDNPSDEDLSRQVRETEIAIVRLTGEAIMDYGETNYY
ncbi:MAG: hypothetical protein LBS05_09470 [Tannerellaceae bacterium]|jgi:hypothetical protein|nr:hypothetical protein [Tannerellaceae bacterium]